MLLIALFAVRGLIRGTVAQVFALLGMVGGLWAGGWVLQWVGHQWLGARPAVVFLLLRGLVALLTGLAVVAMFHWCGERLRESVRKGPLGWLDRLGGLAVGAGTGACVMALALVGVLLVAWPRPFERQAARARMTPPLLAGAQRVCTLGDRFVPGCEWLRLRIVAAERRVKAGPRHS